MAIEIKTKKTFGTISLDRISPELDPTTPKALNIYVSFEEALKLYFGLGQALAKLNGYDRSTIAGKNSAVNMCVYPHTRQITLNEGQLKKKK